MSKNLLSSSAVTEPLISTGPAVTEEVPSVMVTPTSPAASIANLSLLGKVGTFHHKSSEGRKHVHHKIAQSPLLACGTFHHNIKVLSDAPASSTGGATPYIKNANLNTDSISSYNYQNEKKKRMFVKRNGEFNINRKWAFKQRMKELWIRDKFHTLLSFSPRVLLSLAFLFYVFLAIVMAIILSFITRVSGMIISI